MVASGCPGSTWSPTLTSTDVSWPPLGKPRFCSVIALSDPGADTAVDTDARSTFAVLGAGGAAAVQPATTPTTVSPPIAHARTRG